jgi:bacterial/archaeal transporter family-2 protein
MTGEGGRVSTPLLFCALLLGLGLSVQVAMNTRMRGFAAGPVGAALISFAVGTLALLAEAPWWSWGGGLLGAVYVLGAVVLAPRIGPGALLGAVVAGQMSAALLLEHFGWLGTVQHPVSVLRVLGVLLIVGGVALVRAF